MREIHFTPDGWDAYVWWQGQDRKTLKRINTLIILRPEPRPFQ